MSVDLSTRYLGLQLANPLIASAGPSTGKLDTLKRLEDAGVGAVVLPSLFEEQIEHEELAIHDLYEAGTDSFAEALSYLPDLRDYPTGSATYLHLLESAKRSLEIPVIASLNGTSTGGWTRYARLLEDAGADALELNIYLIATDPDTSGEQVEARYVELVQSVRQSVGIPIAVKIGPFFSSIPHMARKLAAAGANGLVLFNRFLQPDIDLATLTVGPHLVLSTSDELRLPLRWISILKGRIQASLAATTGVHTVDDVVKLLLAGADATMMTSALLQHGPDHVARLRHDLRRWLEEREYTSVRQMCGSLSQLHCPDPAAFERANYVRALVTYSGRGAST